MKRRRVRVGIAAIVGVLTLTGYWAWWNFPQPRHVIVSDSPQATSQIRAALDDYAAQGFPIGAVKIIYNAQDQAGCEPTDYGRFLHWWPHSVVHICEDQRFLYHELAHVWTWDNMDWLERRQFDQMLGTSSWNMPTDRWSERGSEQAAEILAVAVAGDANPDHMRIPTDATGQILAALRFFVTASNTSPGDDTFTALIVNNDHLLTAVEQDAFSAEVLHIQVSAEPSKPFPASRWRQR